MVDGLRQSGCPRAGARLPMMSGKNCCTSVRAIS
jgi:hypothetical protein